MKKLIFYIVILFLFFSCKSQQLAFSSLYGTFEGTDGFYYVELNLNQDGTCSLSKAHSLARIQCIGEWSMLNGNLIEIKCNRNPELDDITKALISGGVTEGNLEVEILNKNKLKLGNVVLKRK